MVKPLLATVLLLVLSVVPLAAQSAPADDRSDSAAEAEMVRLLNADRARAGLPALSVDARLTRAARDHSVLMAQRGQLSHQFAGEPAVSSRLAATETRFDRSGENVALDSSDAASAHQGLMLSPPHRANILSPDYNAVGIGVVRKGELLYVTEDFAHRLPEYTPEQAENAAAAAFLRMRRDSPAFRLQRINLPSLRDLACAMARKGTLDTRPARDLPQARYAAAYTQGDPQQLPASASRLAADRNLTRFAVGACFARSNHYPSGTWWVLMVFY